jgi:GNAT superfamily N-acetyltransferase
VPTWDGWAERSAEENTSLRHLLCTRGEWDGLLAYDAEHAVGWCQVGPRDRLGKLVAQLELDPDPSAWCVSCFLVAPSHRGRGVAAALLAAAIALARAEGAGRLEGYPREGGRLEEGEAWTGPGALFTSAGFEVVRSATPRSVVSLDF